jgi:hypothetical protein
MSEQTSTLPPPPAAGAGVVGAGAVEAAELAGALALAVVATDGVAAEFDGEASSAAVAVAGSTVVGAIAAFDFVAGLHAAQANATTVIAAAGDSARTCMAAPCSDDLTAGSLPPNRG